MLLLLLAGHTGSELSALGRCRYSGLCADMVRSVLKEPAKGKAKGREVVYFRSAVWKDGKPEKQVITDLQDTAAAPH